MKRCPRSCPTTPPAPRPPRTPPCPRSTRTPCPRTCPRSRRGTPSPSARAPPPPAGRQCPRPSNASRSRAACAAAVGACRSAWLPPETPRATRDTASRQAERQAHAAGTKHTLTWHPQVPTTTARAALRLLLYYGMGGPLQTLTAACRTPRTMANYGSLVFSHNENRISRFKDVTHGGFSTPLKPSRVD